MTRRDEIVFEDLHGNDEPESAVVSFDDEGDSVDRKVAPDEEFDDINPFSRYAMDDGDDDDEEDDPEGDDEAEDDDDRSYSRKVRARIDRERKVTQEARSEADYWKKKAQGMEAEQASRDKSRYEDAIKTAESRISETEKELSRAIEDGETENQVRLTSQLTDLKAQKIQAEHNLEHWQPPTSHSESRDGSVDAGSSSKGDEWAEKQADWFGLKGFERQTKTAYRLDREIAGEGYDPGSDEYFEELDKRLRKAHPEVYDDEKPKPKPRKRSTVAPVDGEGRRGRRRSEVELDEDDFENMRIFGLNPDDPEVLKEYARNKTPLRSRR